jgi:hypothetical protein
MRGCRLSPLTRRVSNTASAASTRTTPITANVSEKAHHQRLPLGQLAERDDRLLVRGVRVRHAMGQCSETSCHSSGWKSRQQRSPDTIAVISSDGEGDRSVESLEVKAPVGWVMQTGRRTAHVGSRLKLPTIQEGTAWKANFPAVLERTRRTE